jgi:hypothetical protein
MNKSHLTDNFWKIPHIASTTMTRKQLQDTLLFHDGHILANGSFWDIIFKHLGVGVYKVTLKKQGE